MKSVIDVALKSFFFRGDRLSEPEPVESLLSFKSPGGLGHQVGGLGHHLSGQAGALGHLTGQAGGLGHLASQAGAPVHSPGHILNWTDDHGPQVRT